MGAPQPRRHSAKIRAYRYFVSAKRRYNVFILSRDITWAHDQRVMWLWKRELLSQSQNCANFDAYKTCGSRDIMFLFCHATLCEHMIKVTYDLVSTNPFNLSQHYTKFYAFRSCGSRNKTFLFCHVTSGEHMIQGSCDFVKRSPQPKLPLHQFWC